MTTKPNFLRLFNNAYQGVKTSGDIALLPLYSSLEGTILSAEYSTTQPDVVEFFYRNTEMTDKELGEQYYEHFPKPSNVRGVGEVMRPQSVRNKRKALSDQLYLVFGDDFFDVLLREQNYKEVNWRKNIINHRFFDVSRLMSTDASRVLVGIANTAKASVIHSKSDKDQPQNISSSSGDLVNFDEATSSVYSLDDCKRELDFMYRYLDPALVLASNNLDPEKVSYVLSVMKGTVDKSLPGTRLDALSQILSRSAFARPAIEGSD